MVFTEIHRARVKVQALLTLSEDRNPLLMPLSNAGMVGVRYAGCSSLTSVFISFFIAVEGVDFTSAGLTASGEGPLQDHKQMKYKGMVGQSLSKLGGDSELVYSSKNLVPYS